MTIDEFQKICSEVFENRYDKNGNRISKINFPEGCKDCPSGIEWDCYHLDNNGQEIICAWRENYWKYDEVRSFMLLDRVQRGRGSLAGINIGVMDFVKLSILREYYGS